MGVPGYENVAILFKVLINQQTKTFRNKKRVIVQSAEGNQASKGLTLQVKNQIKEENHRMTRWSKLYSFAHGGEQ